MPYHFFPMIARMRYISRWGLMRNTDLRTSRSTPTWWQCWPMPWPSLRTSASAGRPTRAVVAVAALYHDASEILTGDMPTPIKYDNPDIQTAYKAVEAVAEQKLLSMLPPDLRPAYDEAITIPDPHVRDLVKAADKLSAYLKCLEELKAGNTEFRKAKEQTYAALLQNPLPALRCFMEELLPGFELTLDELS